MSFVQYRSCVEDLSTILPQHPVIPSFSLITFLSVEAELALLKWSALVVLDILVS